jgi:phosphoglycerate dehydrogenase-like enzyme
VRRRPDGDPVPVVERIVGLDELDQVLPSCDSVVVALPGTRDTQHLLDAPRLELLGPHAVLVNVGRGSVVDSDALLAALEALPLAHHVRASFPWLINLSGWMFRAGEGGE